jgi:hypothetical protein
MRMMFSEGLVGYVSKILNFRSYLYNQYGPGIYPKFIKFERGRIQVAKTYNQLIFLMTCKTRNIVPKGLLILKAPYHSYRSSKINLRASKALLRDRVQFQCSEI